LHDQYQDHDEYQAEPAAAVIAHTLEAARRCAEASQQCDDQHDEQYGSQGHPPFEELDT
jgi:hypothetical protein